MASLERYVVLDRPRHVVRRGNNASAFFFDEDFVPCREWRIVSAQRARLFLLPGIDEGDARGGEGGDIAVRCRKPLPAVRLAGAGSADFAELKRRLKASDGNLSVHLHKLEEAGYVAAEKSFKDRKPLTHVTLTDKGRAAFVAYLDEIEKLLPH